MQDLSLEHMNISDIPNTPTKNNKQFELRRIVIVDHPIKQIFDRLSWTHLISAINQKIFIPFQRKYSTRKCEKCRRCEPYKMGNVDLE